MGIDSDTKIVAYRLGGQKFPQIYSFRADETALDEGRRSAFRNVELYAGFIANGSKNPQHLEALRLYLDAEYYVTTYGEFCAEERAALLSGEPEEISEEKFEEALNCLPPMHWEHKNGVEQFIVSEPLTGVYHHQYAKFLGKFYTKLVDATDRQTWLNVILPDMIIRKGKAKILAGAALDICVAGLDGLPKAQA